MGNQTTVFGSLAISAQIQFAIPYIDPNSLQPTIDGGSLNGIPTGGGFVYVPSPNNVNAAFASMGALQVGTAGDYTGTDPINAGAQIDSFVPSTIQALGTVGGYSGHTVSTSRGTRYIPLISLGGDTIGEFGAYAYGTLVGAQANSYQRLAATIAYVQGASVTNPGGELRFGTKADVTNLYTEWLKISNAGAIQASGKLYPATDAGVFQTFAGIYAGTGVPNNANGANGDFYLRSDGGVATCIYQKRAGAWIATGA